MNKDRTYVLKKMKKMGIVTLWQILKVFDSSTLIGIFSDIQCMEFVDYILKLSHELAVPYYVFKNELKDELALVGVQNLVERGKIKILPENSTADILSFPGENYGINLGECGALLSCQKLAKPNFTIYCILDDADAGSAAADNNVQFTGLLGVIKLLRDKKIITQDKYTRTIKLLKKSKFRTPRNYPED